jgi:hypothetical protein
MTVSALIQQQRQILHALLNAVRQYQQEIAQAQERLERTLEQIQADKAAAEQEAKREYEQARDKCITATQHRLRKDRFQSKYSFDIFFFNSILCNFKFSFKL